MRKVLVGRYEYVECECGGHLIDLFSVKWTNNNVYSCNTCDSPLVIKGDNQKFYYVGREIR